jgi:small subunit ribosomal protein S20
MPKKKRSALKRIRQTRRRTVIKTLARSSARTAAKAARDAIAAGAADAAEAVRAATSALDKAVKRGGLHKNAARRRTSRLSRQAAKKTSKG